IASSAMGIVAYEPGFQTSLLQHSASLADVRRIHQQTTRKGTDGAFGDTHELIGHQRNYAAFAQHCLRKADDHGIVTSQHFPHGPHMPLRNLQLGAGSASVAPCKLDCAGPGPIIAAAS